MLESPSETLARQMPKVLLHEHLDGGLRVSTLLELLAERGLPPTLRNVNLTGGEALAVLTGITLTDGQAATPAK